MGVQQGVSGVHAHHVGGQGLEGRFHPRGNCASSLELVGLPLVYRADRSAHQRERVLGLKSVGRVRLRFGGGA